MLLRDYGSVDRTLAQQVYQEFEEFKRGTPDVCRGKIADEDCLPLERKWNNAAFAAFNLRPGE